MPHAGAVVSKGAGAGAVACAGAGCSTATTAACVQHNVAKRADPSPYPFSSFKLAPRRFYCLLA